MGRDSKLNPFANSNIPIIGQGQTKQRLSTDALDLMGRALLQGDAVLLPGAQPVFVVASIRPSEEPGLLDVEVRARQVLRVRPNMPVREIVRVAEGGEVQPPQQQQAQVPDAATAAAVEQES